MKSLKKLFMQKYLHTYISRKGAQNNTIYLTVFENSKYWAWWENSSPFIELKLEKSMHWMLDDIKWISENEILLTEIVFTRDNNYDITEPLWLQLF